VLLADEPTANIDSPQPASDHRPDPQTCSEEKIALVMVTHSMEIAGQFPRVDRLDEINRATGLVATK